MSLKIADPIPIKVISNVQFNTEWDLRQGNFSLLHCGSYYLAVVRIGNMYTTDVGHYRSPSEKIIHKSALVALKLDLNFKVISDPVTFLDKAIASTFHLEDARLFRYKGEIWSSFAVRPVGSLAFTMGFACLEGILQGKQVSKIYLVKPHAFGSELILYEPGKAVNIFPTHYSMWEKNWMPIPLFEGSMTFVYNISPLILVSVSPEDLKITYSESPVRGELRGSSNFIKWKKGWLGVTHRTLWRTKSLREYEHQLVYLTEDEVKISPSFTLINPQVEIVNCLLPGKTEGSVYLCLGECDEHSRVIQVDTEAIWQ